jgi:signal transduction histidine kinase
MADKMSKLNWTALVLLILGVLTSAKADDKPSPIALTQDEQAWLDTQDIIQVGVNHGWAPVEFIDASNDFSGLSIEFIKRLQSRLPSQFEFKQSKDDIYTEDAQILSAVPSARLLEDTPFVATTQPYLTIPYVIFVRKDEQSIHSIDDLAGKKVAVFKTGAAARALEKNHPDIELVRADIADEALSSLIAGNVDAYIGNLMVISYVAKNLGIGNVKIAADTPYQGGVYMGIRRDLPHLKSIIEKGLSSITVEERNAIARNWVTVTYEHQTDYRLLFLITGVLISVLVVILLWSRQLKREIVRREQVEKELRQAMEQAEKANLAKSEFLTRMSHELKTPMHAILGFSELLESDSKLEEQEKEILAEISKAGNHLLFLINDLLDLSRIETGKLAVNMAPTNVDEVLNESIQLISTFAEQHHIAIDKPQSSALWVQADQVRLKQVLINLLSNAVKYNQDAGHVMIEGAPVEHGQVEIRVQDTGLGIPAAAYEIIFRPFERLESHASLTEGVGVGLSISKHLINMMGGSISIMSQEGKGSTFIITLPLTEPYYNHHL